MVDYYWWMYVYEFVFWVVIVVDIFVVVVLVELVYCGEFGLCGWIIELNLFDG